MDDHVLWDQFDSEYMTTVYYAVAGFPELILTFVEVSFRLRRSVRSGPSSPLAHHSF